MLEIPESLTLAKQLNDIVKGKRIIEAKAAHTPHSFAWYAGDPARYSEIMEGCVVGESTSIGSMVEMRLGEYSFVVGDGTNVRFYGAGEKLPERYQTRITLEDDGSLICTVQMYGAMFLIRPEIYDNPYYLAGVEKPLPGTEDFDYEYFTSLRENVSGSMSIKGFLATEQRIPGLGNGVLQDILLQAGLHPKKKIGTLTESRWKQVYQAVVETLAKMTAAGGRDTEKNLFGEKGGYATMLSKKTYGKGCPYCGTIVQKTNYMGGTVYFCPGCQEV